MNCIFRWLASALWVTSALSGTPLAAQEKSHISISDAFGRFRYTTDRVPGNACGIVMSLDREAFIRTVPLLKAMELLNPEYVTQTRMNAEPTVLATGFAIQMAPLAVKDLYVARKSPIAASSKLFEFKTTMATTKQKFFFSTFPGIFIRRSIGKNLLPQTLSRLLRSLPLASLLCCR